MNASFFSASYLVLAYLALFLTFDLIILPLESETKKYKIRGKHGKLAIDLKQCFRAEKDNQLSYMKRNVIKRCIFKFD